MAGGWGSGVPRSPSRDSPQCHGSRRAAKGTSHREPRGAERALSWRSRGDVHRRRPRRRAARPRHAHRRSWTAAPHRLSQRRQLAAPPRHRAARAASPCGARSAPPMATSFASSWSKPARSPSPAAYLASRWRGTASRARARRARASPSTGRPAVGRRAIVDRDRHLDRRRSAVRARSPLSRRAQQSRDAASLDCAIGGETRRRRAVRQTLVASQIALAMIMLGGAALLARSLARLENQDAGYVSEHLSILQYSWNARQYNSKEKMIELSDRLLSRIEAIPGVTAATPIYTPPLLGLNIMQQRVDREGQTNDEAEKNASLPLEVGGPDFFKTFGIRILRGRAFTEDRPASRRRTYRRRERGRSRVVSGPAEDHNRQAPAMPVDSKRSITPGATQWRTIVGVTRTTRICARCVRPAPIVYFPDDIKGTGKATSPIRATSTSACARAGASCRGYRRRSPHRPLENSNDGPTARRTARSAATRHHAHVGLRLGRALARGDRSLRRDDVARARSDARDSVFVSRLARRQLARCAARCSGGAAIVTGIGAAVGLVGALAVSRLFASLLFQVAPTDPVSLGGSCLVLLAVGALAAYLPARRATKIDPVQALRAD